MCSRASHVQNVHTVCFGRKMIAGMIGRVGKFFGTTSVGLSARTPLQVVPQATSRSFFSTLFQRTHNQPPILPAEAHRLVGHIGVPDRGSSATNDNCCFARTTCSIVQAVLDCRTFTCCGIFNGMLMGTKIIKTRYGNGTQSKQHEIRVD